VKGQDTLCLRVCNLYGTVIASREGPFAAMSLSDFEPYIDEMFEEYPGIKAIGFGLPGIELGGKIVALDYQRLIGSPIIKHFESRYLVPVLFENDVNAAVLDPDSFILFGEFLSEEHLRAVERRCVGLLPERMSPALSLSKSFTEDFQNGLIAMVLELIERTQGESRA
jgi:hypothetical protein